jgi:hypothetical protein
MDDIVHTTLDGAFVAVSPADADAWFAFAFCRAVAHR